LVQTEETQESSIKFFFVQTEESEYPLEDHGKEKKKKKKKKGKIFLTKTSNSSGKSVCVSLSSTDIEVKRTFLGFAVEIKLEKSQEKFE
jgi:hypothetical protein